MMLPSKFSTKTNIKILNWAGGTLIITYLLSMFIVPLFQGNGNWSYLQNIWDRWQGLNVGMLALASSLIAFNISRYNAEQEKKRNFIAVRAFLPEAFSELTSYCKASMAVFVDAWPSENNQSNESGRTALVTPIPSLPEGYRAVFQDCIKVAEPEVGDALAYILMRLQVHHSRLLSLIDDIQTNAIRISSRDIIITYLYRIAEIQAKINKLFNYMRGLEKFDNSPLVWEDYRNVLSLSNISPEDYQGLQGFIERAIARNQGKANA